MTLVDSGCPFQGVDPPPQMLGDDAHVYYLQSCQSAVCVAFDTSTTDSQLQAAFL